MAADASQDVFNNNTDSVQDTFNEQSESDKGEVHNLEALDQHKDEISMNVTDEEEIVETKSDSAHNSFNEQHVEAIEVEAQSSNSNLNQHHALNLTEDEIGEENIEKESDFPQDAFYEHSYQAEDNFQTNENRTINGNVKNKLNLFQGKFIDQSEPVMNETEGSDDLSDHGMDDGQGDYKVENQTNAANVESTPKQHNNVTLI